MQAARIRIANGRILDPSQELDERGDVVIENDRIVGVHWASGHAPASSPAERVVDAESLVVAPGFVDLHCHLREPGLEYKETIATGTRAAAAGGFTTVCCMPNTEPTLDTASDIEWIHAVAHRDAVVRVYPIGAITKGRLGIELAELADMGRAGAVAFSDDGNPVRSGKLLRNALSYARITGRPVVDHCEDHDLVDGGVMHEGSVSSRLGLRGAPAESEEAAIARDLALAQAVGGRLHLAHVSTAHSIELVRDAKARGTRVTAEVTPHHLVLTHAWVAGFEEGVTRYDTNCRVNPPLRTEEDRVALIRGVADGTIDAIATDHAPHDVVDKNCEFDRAAPGISGLETAFGLLMRLVAPTNGDPALPLATIVRALTMGASRAFNLDLGTLRVGALADLVLLDPDAHWTVDVQRFHSKGKNSPLDGQDLRGIVRLTMVGGKIVHEVPR